MVNVRAINHKFWVAKFRNHLLQILSLEPVVVSFVQLAPHPLVS